MTPTEILVPRNADEAVVCNAARAIAILLAFCKGGHLRPGLPPMLSRHLSAITIAAIRLEAELKGEVPGPPLVADPRLWPENGDYTDA
jgi:hypothetical protein